MATVIVSIEILLDYIYNNMFALGYQLSCMKYVNYICYAYYYYKNTGASNMSKKVKYLSQQNPIILKTPCKLTSRKRKL